MGKGDTCGNTTGMETGGVAVIPRGWNMFIQEPHKILPKIKNQMHAFFSPIFLSDFMETTLANKLCNKTRRQSMDPKVAADLRQSTDRKDLWRGPKWLGTKLSAPQVVFSTQVLISAGFYWEDIISVLLTTEAFTAKLPGALKATKDYQQQQDYQDAF